MNAFDMLMQGASQRAAANKGTSKRAAQQQQQQSKRSKLCTSLSAPLPPVRPFSSETLTPASQPEPTASLGSPDVASGRQEAIAAFKRVFSGRAQHRKQKYKYLLVYDLEATCNRARDLAPVEIIELSCAVISTSTMEIQGTYQAYVRPTEHPQLDPFCIDLTGIQQHQVDRAETLQRVLHHHHEWLQEQGLLQPEVQFVPVTWTEWDFKIALCTECTWRRIQRPDYLCSWVDLKKYFTERFKRGETFRVAWRLQLYTPVASIDHGMLARHFRPAGLTWQGRAHSGLDDALNTARLAIKLMGQGAVFEVTQTSENVPVGPPRAASAEVAGAAGQGSNNSSAGSGQNRSSMQALAAAKGVVGVFDSTGRWTGRCFCKVKAHFRTTKRPGPNHGRQFYSCGRWRITQQSEQCAFFLWKEDVPGGSVVSG